MRRKILNEMKSTRMVDKSVLNWSSKKLAEGRAPLPPHESSKIE